MKEGTEMDRRWWSNQMIRKLGSVTTATILALGVLPGRVVAPDSVFAPRITIEKNLPPGRYRPTQQLEAF